MTAVNRAPREYAPAPSLASVHLGADVLQVGDEGPAVEDFQRLANLLGFNLEVDGKFGPKTYRAARAIQVLEERVLEDGTPLAPNGVVSQSTLMAMHELLAVENVERARQSVNDYRQSSSFLVLPPPGTTARPRRLDKAPPSFSQFAPEPGRATGPFAAARSEREEQAEEILRAQGVWPPEHGRTVVVQIDQDSPPPPTSGPGHALIWDHFENYGGQMGVFIAELAGGVMRLRELTEPLSSASQQTFHIGAPQNDIDGDGRGDIAVLRTGAYYLDLVPRHSPSRGIPVFWPSSNAAMRVARDLDHDGAISVDESGRTSQQYATALQIHPGNPEAPTSAGCQNVHYDQWYRFVETMAQGRGRGFTRFLYVLARRPNEDQGTGARPW